jgi:hypothetical protein
MTAVVGVDKRLFNVVGCTAGVDKRLDHVVGYQTTWWDVLQVWMRDQTTVRKYEISLVVYRPLFAVISLFWPTN